MSAAAVAAGAVAVESANVVGVTTVNATQGKFYMIGAQFEDVGGGEMSIQDFVTGTFVGVNYDEKDLFMQTAPKLQVWTPTGYIPCYYLNDAYDLDKDDGTTYPGWADVGGNYITDTVTAGMAAWFMDGNEDCAITVKGQVLGTDGTIQTTANKFFMVANPFPVAAAINSASIDWDGIVGVNYDEKDQFMQTAPKLQVWTPTGYIPCYYLNDAYDLDKDDGTTYPGWADVGGNYITDNFPVGYAAWFYAGTDVDITFSAP